MQASFYTRRRQSRTRLLRTCAAALVIGVLAVLAVSATALAAVNGQFKQFSLAQGGCMANGAPGGCKAIMGSMANVGEPTLSVDGLHVYVLGCDSDTLNWFDRDSTTNIL